MVERQYDIMELDRREDLINEIKDLEGRISMETGNSCVLIAYTNDEIKSI